MSRKLIILLSVVAPVIPCAADEALYRYEGDVLPYDESLAEYFVRLNSHLLGDVNVVEVDSGVARSLHGYVIA